MKLDSEYLRQHYAGLSDEALGEIDRNELVEVARGFYDEEVARRRSTPRPVVAEAPPDVVHAEEDSSPDWLEGAACVCGWRDTPGGDAAGAAAEARDVIEAAGIPCHIALENVEEHLEYRVLVPGARNLEAASILDRDLFNARMEADWRAHLGELSDSALRALSPKLICAGLLDRAERLKRVYQEEIARRTAGDL